MPDTNAKNPLVSLIVVTYNSAALLPDCLGALAATRYAPCELLVVDNASADGTAARAAALAPNAQVLANHENIGFGRACNQGAAAARGELLVFINPDVRVTPEWLHMLVEDMRDTPDAGLIAPTTLYPDEAPPQVPTRLGETAALPGAALMVRRAAWQQLGGFDERFFLYWEDTDLCWRAWLLGWRVLEDFRALVYHERGGSAGGRRWDDETTKNSLRTYLKTMRWRRIVPFAAALAFKTMAKIVRFRQPALLGAWAWNVRHLGETLALRRELGRMRRGSPARLERLIDIHTARNRRARRERQQHAIP